MKNRFLVLFSLILSLNLALAHSQFPPDYDRLAWLETAEQLKPELSSILIHPVSVVSLIENPGAFQGWEATKVGPTDSLYASPFNQIQSIVLDFGDHYTGYFSFELTTVWGTSDGPTRLKFTFGEVPSEVAVPFDPYPGDLSRAWLQDEIITLMDIPASVTLERRVAFRYVKIELMGSSPFFGFAFTNVQVKALTSAGNKPDELSETTPSLIRDIDRVGLKTLSECMQTVYEDGPKRDRRLWVGDLYLESLANSFSFKNHDLTKRCLYLLAGLTDDAGIVLGTIFETPEPHAQAGQRLMDYALLFNVSLSYYLKVTGDTETARDLWPVARHQLSIIRNYVGENGLIDFERANREWWIFIDWKEGLHKEVAIQGIMIYALKESYALASMLNKEGEISFAPGLTEKMVRASMRHYYNQGKGIFESGPEHQISYASQIWMALAGVPSDRQGRKALENVTVHEEALFPGGPYLFHYFIEALIGSGLPEMAKKSLIRYWGGMIGKGADTFWEVYDPEDDYLSPYHFYPVNSYCHAWSCTPVYFIRKYPEIFQRND